eukprot:TRINITY_DN22970_c0_g1_i1.p1 TRINITY_DN22970_c0_g1~~TRINITY_DN22970_c0_g1_i1.p1  ORF type:complete len:254 (-),score=48.31 TRINITY_DN22970_c0_g1_i1:275-985(-)
MAGSLAAVSEQQQLPGCGEQRTQQEMNEQKGPEQKLQHVCAVEELPTRAPSKELGSITVEITSAVSGKLLDTLELEPPVRNCTIRAIRIGLLSRKVSAEEYECGCFLLGEDVVDDDFELDVVSVDDTIQLQYVRMPREKSKLFDSYLVKVFSAESGELLHTMELESHIKQWGFVMSMRYTILDVRMSLIPIIKGARNGAFMLNNMDIVSDSFDWTVLLSRIDSNVLHLHLVLPPAA